LDIFPSENIEWIINYKAARRGFWIEDRMRFERRIVETEEKIGWIFANLHRQEIFSSSYSS
jgi:hypothetical protein